MVTIFNYLLHFHSIRPLSFLKIYSVNTCFGKATFNNTVWKVTFLSAESSNSCVLAINTRSQGIRKGTGNEKKSQNNVDDRKEEAGICQIRYQFLNIFVRQCGNGIKILFVVPGWISPFPSSNQIQRQFVMLTVSK